MIVAKKEVQGYRIFIHDFDFGTLYRGKEQVRRENWTSTEDALVELALEEAIARQGELPRIGWIQLRL